MKRIQLISLGYGILGVALFASVLPELSDFLTSSTVSAFGVLLVCVGSVGMVVMGIASIFRPEGRFGLGQTADSRLHLYGIWGAVVLAIVGILL